MTVPEMQARLRRAKVPDWFYVTDGGLGAGKSLRDTCPDEDTACRAMIRHIDRMMRQAGLGSVSADG